MHPRTSYATNQLKRLDPARDIPPTPVEILHHEARAIITSAGSVGELSRHQRYTIAPPRFAAIALAACIALLVAIALPVVANLPNNSLRATPALLSFASDNTVLGADRLLIIADRAAASGQPTAVPGGYDHVVIDAWYLNSQVAAGTTTSIVSPERTDLWRADNGSGRIHRDRQEPADAGWFSWLPGASPLSQPDEDFVFSPGEYSDPFTGRPPLDQLAFDTWLMDTNYPNTADGRASALADLLGVRALLPEERAVALRFLAAVPGVSYAGSVVDRAGRRGEGFSVESAASGLPRTDTFIIDPSDGRFLGLEQVLTRDAGSLNVATPAVVSYRTFLGSTFTRSYN